MGLQSEFLYLCGEALQHYYCAKYVIGYFWKHQAGGLLLGHLVNLHMGQVWSVFHVFVAVVAAFSKQSKRACGDAEVELDGEPKNGSDGDRSLALFLQ